MRPSALTAAFAVALIAVAAPACGSDGDVLTVYSGRTSDLINPILERFAEETGVDIEVRYPESSADTALQIDTEGDRSPADVFISQSPGATGFLDERGRLAPLPERLLDLVPSEDHAGDGSWVGLTGRVRTLVYNPELIAEADLPASVLDVVDERYRGQVAVAPPNGSFQDFVTGMRSELGDEAALDWLDGLADNDPETFPNNVAILEAVNRGEIAMGLINHYYWFQGEAEGIDQPSRLHFFDDGDLGSMLLVTTASIIEGTDQEEDALRLVEYLLGEEAQRYFAEETIEYPLAAGVSAVEGLPPLDTVVSSRIDFDVLGGLEVTERLIEQSGLPEA
jgi:iron(III) transport system substrate-binding protein